MWCFSWRYSWPTLSSIAWPVQVLSHRFNHHKFSKHLKTNSIQFCRADSWYYDSKQKTFIKYVVRFLPQDFSTNSDMLLQFCGPSGADAVGSRDQASQSKLQVATPCLLFRGATTARKLLFTMGMMGNLGTKERRSSLMSDVMHFMPFPYNLRCRLALVVKRVLAYGHSLHPGVCWQMTTNRSVKPAAMIVEPVLARWGRCDSSSGVLATRPTSASCDEHGILLIFWWNPVWCRQNRSSICVLKSQALILIFCACLKRLVADCLCRCLYFDKSIDTWKAGEHTGTFR